MNPSDPNINPANLLGLAKEFSKEVLKNVSLELISLEDPAIYEEIIDLCYRIIAMETWAYGYEHGYTNSIRGDGYNGIGNGAGAGTGNGDDGYYGDGAGNGDGLVNGEGGGYNGGGFGFGDGKDNTNGANFPRIRKGITIEDLE